jgi:muramoyltetrapeptide carboxypeptidase
MKIHLIAPSGASPDLRSPQSALAWLKQQGVIVTNPECTQRVFQRFAGTDAERLAELNAIANLDPSQIVMSVRGGYGLHRLLDQINWKAIAIAAKQGLQICGHSDFTGFQLGLLAKTGVITLAGPMLNYDFGPLNEFGEPEAPSQFTWTHFQSAIKSRRFSIAVPDAQRWAGDVDLSQNIEGMLWGGNLSIITTLLGTEYFPSEKQTNGGILFIEDINEHPYRIERMLLQLHEAGVLENQHAIILGHFNQYRLYEVDRGYNLDTAIDLIRERMPKKIPILTGLPFGHIKDKLTLPVGAHVNLQASAKGFVLEGKW